MSPEARQFLAAQFRAEAESAIRYGLAEGLNPHHEYAMLVARLHAESGNVTASNRKTQFDPHFEVTTAEWSHRRCNAATRELADTPNVSKK